ncbi:MAG: sel1 repeat family protein, partial [Desulfovibrio sp.]|nr:sel1 repeat family protein [Desulfovibrio sp.]
QAPGATAVAPATPAPAAGSPSRPAQPAAARAPVVEAPKAPAAPGKEQKPARSGNGQTGKQETRTPPPQDAKKAPDRKAEGVPPRAAPTAQAEEAAAAYAAGDYRLAERIWREQAEDGDGQAMNNLGVLYDLGQGVEMDTGRALHWFAESAKTGNPAGMSNYGRMLEQGRGIAPNPEEAARWFDLAARQGQAEAQYNLGMLYELGRGVSRDVRAAAAWYSRAAAQQQTEAMFRLGHCYRVGQGVEKNASRAVLLLYAAAMNGNADAMRALEDMARESGPRPEAVLFGQRLDNTDRKARREALKRFGDKIIREDDAHICDMYEAGSAAPGARRMALCYGPGPSGPLGFLELDYNAPDNKVGAALLQMVTQRFGPASAGEGDDAHLWNLGSVVVATRYEPTHGLMSLMYMVPRVYHLTRQD